MLALLMESALRSLLVGLAVWLGLRIFRVRSPHLQMTAWMVVLAASLAMPVLMRGLTVTVPAGTPPLVKIERLPPERLPDVLMSPYLQPDVPAYSPPAAEHDAATLPRVAPAARIDGRSAAGWWYFAAVLYLLVAGVMLFRLLLGLVLTWRLCRAAQSIREPWTAGTDMRVSSTVVMPVTFGATILLPADFAEWSAIKRQAALSHERSHVARGDFYILLVAGLNRCLFWFSPLSWWLVRTLTELAETLSDDAAIEAIGDRASYAEVLLDVASRVGRLPAAIPMARPHAVRLRIERILAAPGLPARIGWRRRASFATTLLPVVAVCAVTIAPGGSPNRAIAQNAPAANVGGDPRGLDRYVGLYRPDPAIMPDIVVTITREGGHLFEQQTGRVKFEIFPQNDDEFFYGMIEARDSRITFVRNAQGRATGMVLHGAGRDVGATRTDEAEARRASDLYAQRLVDQARPRTALAIDPGVFDRYVGTYALNPRAVFRITRDGDRLFARLTGQVRVEQFPENETDFFAKVVPAQITFVVSGQGQATALVLHQGGREMPAQRVDEAQALQADAAFEEQTRRLADQSRSRTAISVDPQSQDRYVGFYEAGPQQIFVVTRAGDQLFAQLTGQRSLPIFPEREGEYFYKAAAAQITFVADSQGHVSELVQHQYGRDFLRAMRIGDIPAADRTAAVDPATFDSYAGSYEPPAPRNVVTVTREGDRLFMQETGQAKTEIIPRSAVGYTSAAGSSGPAVVFEPADQGQSPALILYDEARGAVRATRMDAAQARQIVAVEARRLADAPERFIDQMPAPGGEAALRHHWEALSRGAPDYDQMAPRLADVIRQQITPLLNWLTRLGAVESTTFTGVGPGGFDIYAVKFTHGVAQIRLSLADDGKLQGLNFRPDGDGRPGALVACSEEDKLSSSPGDVPIRMTLANRSGSDLRVFVRDFSGKRIGGLPILNEETIPAFTIAITQPLIVTDAAERCLEIVLPGTATRHLAITSAAPDGPAGAAAAPRNTPAPGSEAALRQLIDGIRRGEPDYMRMSVQGQNAMRQQLHLFREIAARMGAVQAISFVGVGSAGEDIYQVRAENGSAEVRIDLLKDGRIGSVALGPE
jgi:hypothetical protein